MSTGEVRGRSCQPPGQLCAATSPGDELQGDEAEAVPELMDTRTSQHLFRQSSSAGKQDRWPFGWDSVCRHE